MLGQQTAATASVMPKAVCSTAVKTGLWRAAIARRSPLSVRGGLAYGYSGVNTFCPPFYLATGDTSREAPRARTCCAKTGACTAVLLEIHMAHSIRCAHGLACSLRRGRGTLEYRAYAFSHS